MTLVLDPTQAADTVAADTQKLRAWSQEDDITDVVDYRQANWKTPLLLLSLAVGAFLVAGGYLLWPNAAKQQVAPSAPHVAAHPTIAPVQSPDQRFITLFKSRGGLVEPAREQMVIDEGHQACTRLGNETYNQLIADMLAGTPGMSRYTAELFVNAATDVYCPAKP